eukprot:6490307-Amphidinium_carterae.2
MKKSKNPCGTRCRRCAEAVAKSYPFRDWTAILAEMQVNSGFATEVRKVIMNYSSPVSEKEWPRHNLKWNEVSGYQVYRDYIFISVDQFTKDYGEHPSKVGCSVEKFFDEHGEELEGVLVVKDDGPLHVRAFFGGHCGFEHVLQRHEDTYRPKQVQEFRRAYEEDRQKLVPKGMAKSKDAVVLSQLPKLVADAKVARERQAEEAAAVAAVAPPVEAGADAQQHESSEDEAEDQVVSGMPLPSNVAKGGKKMKGKGKGRGKKRKLEGKQTVVSVSENVTMQSAAGAAPAAPASASAGMPASSARSRSRSPARSMISNALSARVSPRDKMLEKAATWRETVKPSDILDKPNARVVNQVRQTTEALEKTHPAHAQTLLLRAHLDLLELCLVPLLFK